MGLVTRFVVNPRAGNGSAARQWKKLEPEVARMPGVCGVSLTEGPLHAVELAREAAARGADVVVAVGGDGTINEVANGLIEDEEPVSGRAALGIVPLGTGGDFRRSLGFGDSPLAALARLENGRRRQIDLGRLELTTADGRTSRRVFVNIASFGLSGLVVRMVNRSSKALGGKASFALGSLRAVASYANQPVRIALDGVDWKELKISDVAVANGQFFGGGMWIAPEARLDDGLFDVVVVGDLSRRSVLANGPKIYRGRHLGLDGVEVIRASSVAARPLGDEPVLVDVDGEQPGQLPAGFTLLPSALPLVV